MARCGPIPEAGKQLRLIAAITFSWLVLASSAMADPIICQSPSGILAIEFDLRPSAGANHVPHYRVRIKEREAIGWSRLGFDLPSGQILGGACEMTGRETRVVRDEFEQVPGKRRRVIGNANETVIRLRESASPRRQWHIVLRAYDDGVAFRYRFPTQDGWSELAIAGERTQFVLPADTQIFALPLNGFTTSYEKRYRRMSVQELPANWLLGLPLLMSLPNGDWAAITESDVDEFAGLYVSRPGNEPSTLTARLSPLPAEPKLAVRAALPHESPWRVIMAATRPGQLIESDIVLKLGKPRALRDVSWIKPGKTTFPWWNGFALDGVTFQPGLNTATTKHYLDFCAANGIEYHSLDGMNNVAWYGGKIVPYQGADPTKALPEIDLPEVLRYAKSKGVRLRMWMHWGAARQHMAHAFPRYRDWGIEGVMLDFMDRDDQEMNRFVRDAVKLAAENHLTVTLHGCPKPTGLERTYPNLLTHEGVLNLEYNKWDKIGCPPDHQVTVAFTRMLAGPLDFHQGSFRAVSPEEFTPRNKSPFVMGTPSRTLASYVVYQNHLSMVADSPSAYSGHPLLPVLAKIPATWDDTRVPAGDVGEYVAIARRHDSEWHLGVMTDQKARSLSLPLSFLGPGMYSANIVSDDASAQIGFVRREASVTAQENLLLNVAPSGGAYVRFMIVK